MVEVEAEGAAEDTEVVVGAVVATVEGVGAVMAQEVEAVMAEAAEAVIAEVAGAQCLRPTTIHSISLDKLCRGFRPAL